MEETKHTFSVGIERIDGDAVRGIAIKNFTIENLSIPEITLISAMLISQALKYNEQKEDMLQQMMNDIFIKMTIEMAVNGEFDMDKLSQLSQKDFLEHCFNMEHKGED